MKKRDTGSSTQGGRQYWRSLDHFVGSAEYNELVQREFPEGTLELGQKLDRRKFLNLMGASLALAGLTSCRRPVEKIIPYSVAPESIIPGIPKHFATSMPFGHDAFGLVVESHEGRPTKIEGNPQHPSTLGSASAQIQAEILNLYDPDRSQVVLRGDLPFRWADFVHHWRGLREDHLTDKGARLAILSGAVNGPTEQRLVAEFMIQFPQAIWATWEPVNDDNILQGMFEAYGNRLLPEARFDRAQRILSLDDDFLNTGTAALRNSRLFAARRRNIDPVKHMNRLFVVESGYSLTGAMADHRLAIPASQIGPFLAALTMRLKKQGLDLPVIPDGEISTHFDDHFLDALTKDLLSNIDGSLIKVGRSQPPAVHTLAAAVNEGLSRGHGISTLKYIHDSKSSIPASDHLLSLTESLREGKIDTLILLGSNPVYTAPAELKFAELLSSVPNTIHVGSHRDESGQQCHWHIPTAHFLECWGDTSSLNGTLAITQPLIKPLFGSKSKIELINLLVTGVEKTGYELVRESWRKRLKGESFDKAWRRVVHDGVFPESAVKSYSVELRPDAVKEAFSKCAQPPDHGLEIYFQPSASLYDGRYANNGWLQENPDPMTKLTWDNAALVSPETAQKLGVKNEDIIAISHHDATVELPVWIQPGLASDTIVLELGYGRRNLGRIAQGSGTDVYPLRRSDGLYFASEVKVAVTGRKGKLACTQDHHGLDEEQLARQAIQDRLPMIVREATLSEYTKHPNFARERVEHPPLESLFEEQNYDEGYQWGMAIDLNVCTGCSACSIACQSENNIPVVGKEEVSRGREMHWIRLDRYFSGSQEDPEVVFQPVGCQHCENAPCEGVCPVAATVHDEEGLNTMVYNRCIGTRYCANNCPYKVRRFNFFNYTKELPEIVQMAMNPDVTMRFRGVMEKCTYCVQRISRSKIVAKNEGRELKDGDVVSACQQTCPTDAIVFGNLNDPDSKVSQLKMQNLNYELLAELNVQPRTSYLAKLRNPFEEMKTSAKSENKHHDH